MASPRQIAASRANGALSRGPKTREGKARAAGNRCRHGLYSKRTVLRNESQDAFDALLQQFTAALQPATSAEHDLVQQIVSAKWQQNRAIQLHTDILNRSLPANSPAIAWAHAVEQEPAFLQSIRAESRYARRFERGLRDLVCAQTRRRENEHSNPPDAFLMPSQPAVVAPEAHNARQNNDSNPPDETFMMTVPKHKPRYRHVHRLERKQPDSS